MACRRSVLCFRGLRKDEAAAGTLGAEGVGLLDAVDGLGAVSSESCAEGGLLLGVEAIKGVFPFLGLRLEGCSFGGGMAAPWR